MRPAFPITLRGTGGSQDASEGQSVRGARETGRKGGTNEGNGHKRNGEEYHKLEDVKEKERQPKEERERSRGETPQKR